MTEIYGHKFTSSFGDKCTDTWLKGLVGVTPNMIAKGLEHCVLRPDPWPPSLPEFRAMCVGMTTKDQAITEAIQNVNTPIARALQKSVTSWDLQNKTEDQLRKLYSASYDRVSQEVEHHYLSEEIKLLENK